MVFLSFCILFQFEIKSIDIEKKENKLLHLRWFCMNRYQNFVSARTSQVPLTDGLALNSNNQVGEKCTYDIN